MDTKLALSETEASEAIGISLGWLRKDRRTARRIPFYRVGKRAYYSLDRVREALAAMEEGGTVLKRARKAAP